LANCSEEIFHSIESSDIYDRHIYLYAKANMEFTQANMPLSIDSTKKSIEALKAQLKQFSKLDDLELWTMRLNRSEVCIPDQFYDQVAPEQLFVARTVISRTRFRPGSRICQSTRA
jgi:hypothetical protein